MYVGGAKAVESVAHILNVSFAKREQMEPVSSDMDPLMCASSFSTTSIVPFV